MEKNSMAWSTESSNTCAISFPPYSMSSVSRLNLVPLQTSHFTKAGGRKVHLQFDVTCPFALGHRPCALLKENLLGLYPRNRASGTCENNCRITSKNPTYVAGIERGVRPIGDWSTS